MVSSATYVYTLGTGSSTTVVTTTVVKTLTFTDTIVSSSPSFQLMSVQDVLTKSVYLRLSTPLLLLVVAFQLLQRRRPVLNLELRTSMPKP